ncbi:MAG: hypothetical protein OEY49_01240 [Candidatus Heimdallarchaeota archaeon]|nr:hypothetical protein [Candidatus Heimdallarchaeota archaeon]
MVIIHFLIIVPTIFYYQLVWFSTFFLLELLFIGVLNAPFNFNVLKKVNFKIIKARINLFNFFGLILICFNLLYYLISLHQHSIWMDRFSGPVLNLNKIITTNGSFVINPYSITTITQTGLFALGVNQLSIFFGASIVASSGILINNLEYTEIIMLPFFGNIIFPAIIYEIGIQIGDRFCISREYFKDKSLFSIGLISFIGSPLHLLSINPNVGGTIFFGNIGFILLSTLILLNLLDLRDNYLPITLLILIGSILSYRTTGFMTFIFYTILNGVWLYRINYNDTTKFLNIKNSFNIKTLKFLLVNMSINILYGIYLIIFYKNLIPSFIIVHIKIPIEWFIIFVFIIIGVTSPFFLILSLKFFQPIYSKLFSIIFKDSSIKILISLFSILLILSEFYKNVPKIPEYNPIYTDFSIFGLLKRIELIILVIPLVLELNRYYSKLDLDKNEEFLIPSHFVVIVFIFLLFTFYSFGGWIYVVLRLLSYFYPLFIGISSIIYLSKTGINNNFPKYKKYISSLCLVFLVSITLMTTNTYLDDPINYGGVSNEEVAELNYIIEIIGNMSYFSDVRIANAYFALSNNELGFYYGSDLELFVNFWYGTNSSIAWNLMIYYDFLIISSNFMKYGLYSYDYYHRPLNINEFTKFFDSEIFTIEFSGDFITLIRI